MLLMSLLLSLALYRRNKRHIDIGFQSPDYVLVTGSLNLLNSYLKTSRGLNNSFRGSDTRVLCPLVVKFISFLCDLTF
jgi:hypothetical protein